MCALGTKNVGWKSQEKPNGCCANVSHTLLGRCWVPWLSNDGMKRRCFITCQREKWLEWRHSYSSQQEIQNINLNQENLGKCLWDRKGVLVDMPNGTTINAAAYCETLKRLRSTVQNRRRGMLTRRVCLLHDEARAHTARATQQLLQFQLGSFRPSRSQPRLHFQRFPFVFAFKETSGRREVSRRRRGEKRSNY